MERTRIIEQLEQMVATGRLTPDEAGRLRAAEGTAEFDAVLVEVRVRHATAHTDAAVASGSMTPEEAAAALARVRDGEHSTELRRQIRPAR
jgi:hypothetical protein